MYPTSRLVRTGSTAWTSSCVGSGMHHLLVPGDPGEYHGENVAGRCRSALRHIADDQTIVRGGGRQTASDRGAYKVAGRNRSLNEGFREAEKSHLGRIACSGWVILDNPDALVGRC